MGCHDTCKTNDDTYKYFCKGVKEREENLFDLFMQCSIFDEFLAAINRLARDASSLLQDSDTNQADTIQQHCQQISGGQKNSFF
jgi:hypothetical protein